MAAKAAALLAALAGLPAAALMSAAPAKADVVRDSQMWVLDELNVQAAWSVSEGSGVIVAVIDSGVDGEVSDLVGAVRQGPDYSGVDTPRTNPDWGLHGTWMASLIAGRGHGYQGQSGIIGTAPASRVLSIRVITDATDPNYKAYEAQSALQGQSELAKAIDYAVNKGAGVISMSLGYSSPSRAVRQALQYAYDHNVVVVASAGNDGGLAGKQLIGHAPYSVPAAPYSFPADYPGVLAVGAVNAEGQVATFSSENLSVEVAAPGYRVPAQGRDGLYWYVSGTSPACALTAGVVALIKSAYPKLTDSQVISAITSSTTTSTRPPGGYDEQIGFGVVNAAAALTAAKRIDSAAPPSTGVAVAHHFGGGVGAIPAPPVSPRGPAVLILFCLLGLACLGLVALSTSRLFALRESSVPAGIPAIAGGATGTGAPDLSPAADHPAAAGSGVPAPPASGTIRRTGGSAPPARHAAPRGRGHDSATPS